MYNPAGGRIYRGRKKNPILLSPKEEQPEWFINYQKILLKFQQYEIYGVRYDIDLRKGFFIFDHLNESGDLRFKKRGQKCKDMPKSQIVEILWKFQLESDFEVDITNIDMSIFDRCVAKDFLKSLATFSNDKLIFFYRWFKSSSRRDDMSVILEKHFEKIDRLLFCKDPNNADTDVANNNNN